MTEVKLSDDGIHKLFRSMGLDSRERSLVEVALQIYMRKYGSLDEERVRELFKHLERAHLISSNDNERALKKTFEV